MLGKALQTAAAGSAAGGEGLDITDAFSTYLYTGNGSSQTITNGIDLAGEGGLVWLKSRSSADFHFLTDTVRGATKTLYSNATNGSTDKVSALTAFTASGFSIGAESDINRSGDTFASWTFRKAPKFFDVVTYTGDGIAGRTVAHNLGSVPGCIIVKRTDAANYNWLVYHRSLGNSQYLTLETTNPAYSSSTFWNATTPSASVFTVGNTSSTNASGGTYVAYLFAHDAGGFGDDGTESVIKCGSYTGNGSTSGPVIDLGWEPQWVMVKAASLNSLHWYITDDMRGFSVTGQNYLAANLSDAELSGYDLIRPTSTGFSLHTTNPNYNTDGATYIYIAIRRGPMKTPTDATEVFAPDHTREDYSTSGFGKSFYAGFPVDFALNPRGLDGTSPSRLAYTRITGDSFLRTNTTDAEGSSSNNLYWDSNVGWYESGAASTNDIAYMFRRTPGFFDVVAYTGTGSARTVAHNLGVVPELMIVKSRSAGNWNVYSSATGATKYLNLNGSNPATVSSSRWNDTSPTSSVFTVGTTTSASGENFIAYLFATLPGISKVGSYTGTGTTLNIDCGFTTGSRLVLIKRTDSTGSWYIWDSARGIVSGNDPYLLLNSTAAEVTSTDYIDPLASGFQISSTAPAEINASGGSYIFLAIS